MSHDYESLAMTIFGSTNKCTMKRIILLLLILACLPTFFAQKTAAPKLIVGIVIDQMCYEYLYRYQDKFCENGFRKIMEQGTNCRNTQYNYVPTFTGPGHASIYTGTTPNNHGIVANEWFERESGLVINCVEDNSVKSVGTSSDEGLCSPKNMKTNTITDQLKMTYPNAKVVSMSIKDRGAILPGGHLSDGSYWFDYATGKFVTSTFFKKELPKWVADFNAEGQADKYLQGSWNTLLDISAYGESGPDDSPYEHLLQGKTKPTFPYDLKAMCNGVPNYSLFTVTPFANTFLADFALRSIKAENLGQDQQTDMLCISFSTPDIAGHSFGPYSVELEDIYIRLDLEIGKLIKQLEEQVGKDEFVMFLTADHAVVPVPQYLIDKKLPGGYVFLNDHLIELNKSVATKFGVDLVLEQENLNIYLDQKRIDSLKLDHKVVQDYVASEIAKWDGVKRVFTAYQLMNTGNDDEWREMVRKGYHARESGDVLFILEPGYLPKYVDSHTARKGTSHGSAFNYDTHVPLVWYGKGIPAQEVFRRVNITDISATLTHLLYLQRNGAMTGEPILELLGK
jgi:predicted AlkP superfamily pyrophosphatase or phosphodiesterase